MARNIRIFLQGLLLLLIVGVGCTSAPSSISSWTAQNGKVKVLSSTGIIDDLVAEIGGEFVDHTALIMGDVDPHSYELVKGDDEKITFAHVVFANGLNLEHGASFRYHLEHHSHVVYLGGEIEKIVPDQILYNDGELDPHIWMDISLWVLAIDPVIEALSKEDPAHAAQYRANGEDLRAKMVATHEKISSELQSFSEEKRYLVTSHDAFHYFARAYLAEGDTHLDRCVAPAGLAPEGQLSVVDIQRVTDHLCDHKIDVVFPESNVARGALKKIVASCKHKGLNVRLCESPLYGDAMGHKGSGADTYLLMLEHNAKVLRDEWAR